MDDKKDVHHVSPNIDVVKHHKDSLPSWDELKYFVRKYYLFLLIIALIPVVLFTLGQQLANRGSAAPRLQLNSGAKVGVQTGGDSPLCTSDQNSTGAYRCYNLGQKQCQRDEYGHNTGYNCTCGKSSYDAANFCFLGVFICDANKDLIQCPLISPIPAGRDCGPGDQYIKDKDHCGTSSDGSQAKCAVCQSDGTWSGSTELDCPDNERAAKTCSGAYRAFPSVTPGGSDWHNTSPTPVPQGGVKVGCSCLDKPGDACKNSDGSDASRIGNSECPPDGAEGQACCINY